MRQRWMRPRQLLAYAVLLVLVAALVAAGPRLREVMRTLADVHWGWAAASVLANIASLLIRGLGWRALLGGVLEGRQVSTGGALRAYLVGQLVNAALIGRVGEASKIAVYARHLDDPEADWGIVTGAVVAHRVLDTVPLAMLVLIVAISIGVPTWTLSVLGVSALLLLGSLLLGRARVREVAPSSSVGRLVEALRRGLRALRTPRAVAVSAALQTTGWCIEVAGVWLAFQAVGVDQDLTAAGLVVVATNAATLVPFVPGSVGVFQVAVAAVLNPIGVRYSVGLAFGVALQAIEMLATLSAGVPATALEGLSAQALWRSTRRGATGFADASTVGVEAPQRCDGSGM